MIYIAVPRIDIRDRIFGRDRVYGDRFGVRNRVSSALYRLCALDCRPKPGFLLALVFGRSPVGCDRREGRSRSCQKPGFFVKFRPRCLPCPRNPVSFFGRSRGVSETGFLCQISVRMPNLSQKPGFKLANMLGRSPVGCDWREGRSRGCSETGFLCQISVRMPKLSALPGFFLLMQ